MTKSICRLDNYEAIKDRLKAIGTERINGIIKEIAEIASTIDGIDLTQYEDKGVPVINGWYLVSKEINNSLEIGVYEKTRTDGTKEYVIANAGTEDGEDWENNFQQLVGKSPDMEYSIKYAVSFEETHHGSIITFVGHSKGGAEAAGNAVATNCGAILFNPAWLSAYANGLDISNYDAQIDTYIVDGELLHAVEGSILKPIGNVQYLTTQSINPLTNHGMDAVIEGIEDWRNSQE